MVYLTLYHYTDEKGMKGIRSTKTIKMSDVAGPDAVFGRGVYLTTLNPENHSKKTIAANNWDDYGRRWVKQGKVDYAVKLVISEDEIVIANTVRDVYIYQGDIDIEEYQGELLRIH